MVLSWTAAALRRLKPGSRSGTLGIRSARKSYRLCVETLEDRTVLSFSRPVMFNTGPLPTDVAVGDFRNDGKLDLVTANNGINGSVSVLLGNGDGTFQPAVNYPVGSQPSQVIVADLKGDGNLDIVTANFASNTVTLVWGNGDGTFQVGATIATDPNPRSLAVADFNGDGHLDLAVGCSNGYDRHFLDVFLGNGNGTFQPALRTATDGYNISLAVGDFNGDGIPDVATVSSYDVSIFTGVGDGTFLPVRHFAAGHLVYTVTAADLNGDGILDLVTAGYNYGPVTTLRGNGNGTFQAPQPVRPLDFGGAIYAEVADLNGDGIPDIVAINDSGDTINVYQGNGDFTFQAPRTYPVSLGPGSNPRSLAVGDFTGDGRLDVAVALKNFDYVAVLLNQADTTHFGITTSSSTVAGASLTITVAAQDAGNHTVTDYLGTVHFTSTDETAIVPDDYTFTSDDHGAHAFIVTLQGAGSRQVAVADRTASSITGSANVTVNPADVNTFVVAGFPATSTAGSVNTVSVTPEDAFHNTVTGYRGTVTFSSSDGQATLPLDYTFTSADNGTHVFGIVLKTAGTQSLTAADTINSAIAGTLDGLVVNAAAAAFLLLEGPNTIGVDTAFDMRVTVQDAYGNVVTGYLGTIEFRSSDPDAHVPVAYTFTADDAGVHVFSVTLHRPGLEAITALDQGLESLTGLMLVNVES